MPDGYANSLREKELALAWASVGIKALPVWKASHSPAVCLKEIWSPMIPVLTLPEPPPGARHGSVLRLPLTRAVSQPGAWLPLAALAESSRGLWACYVAAPLAQARANGATHKLQRRSLQLHHQHRQRAYVSSELAAGELVVDGGRHKYVPGQCVRLEEPAP